MADELGTHPLREKFEAPFSPELLKRDPQFPNYYANRMTQMGWEQFRRGYAHGHEDGSRAQSQAY